MLLWILLALIALPHTLIWKHGENITRLLAGTEPKVGQKSE